MARVFRTMFLMAFLLIAGKAYAAGGTCPSGPNYLNPTTGSMVTLASLGVTNCYYISAAGSDSNSGTSEASPWLHAPQMPACSGNCAVVQNNNSGIPPGTGLILRGGDTWHMGDSSASPYTGGTWDFNSGQTPSGTSSNPIYLGVDKTWFAGGSWTRPILTGDNPICNASTLSSTCLSSPLSNSGIVQYYLTSCKTIPGGTNDMLRLSARKYYVIDNFELMGLCTTSPGQPDGTDNFVAYGSAGATLTFENLYMHGWSHLRFADQNGAPGCNAGNVCFNTSAFDGSVIGGGAGENILFNVIDGAESDPAGLGFCKHGGYNVAYNVIRYTSQCLVSNLHTFHDNLYEYFFENGHSNVLESNNNADVSPVSAIYNNIFRNLETSGGKGGVALWLSPAVGSTDYVFNNLMYSVGPMEIFNVGLNQGDQGRLAVFNNTIQANSVNGFIFGCQSTHAHPFTAASNHYVVDGTPYSTPCSGLTDMTNLTMTNAAAKSAGYTVSQLYAYSPTSATSPTAGNGTNNSSFCSAIAAAAASMPSLSDAAFVCQNDTSYACTYVLSNHSVSCPARTVVGRPVTAAWDRGAYQSNGTRANAPNPPTNLSAIVQP
jgi:hypothetical protein